MSFKKGFDKSVGVIRLILLILCIGITRVPLADAEMSVPAPDSVPVPVPAPDSALAPEPVPSPAESKRPLAKLKGKVRREKEAEGTQAPNRFDSDPVIKSRYELNGQSLEVDPD